VSKLYRTINFAAVVVLNVYLIFFIHVFKCHLQAE